MSNIKTSIIIPVFNRLEYTQKCLESIFQFGSKYTFEIIIVDNASSDGTKEFLDGLNGKVSFICNEDNLGFAKACNQGAAKATGEYLLFLNNDTIVTENWVDVLIEELDENPEAAIAGSKLLFPDGTIQHAGVVFGEEKTPYHIYYRESQEKPYVNKKRMFQAVTGACLLIKKEAFDEVSGFDETYLNGFEDIDLCMKVGKLKKSVIYCPESIVYHYESISDGRLDKHKENTNLFLKKWSDDVEVDYVKFMTEDGTASQMLFQKERIHQLEEEIAQIKSSGIWKIQGFLLRLKFAIFSPKQLIKKYFR